MEQPVASKTGGAMTTADSAANGRLKMMLSGRRKKAMGGKGGPRRDAMKVKEMPMSKN